MIKVEIDDKAIDWPSSWNELTREQLLCIADLFAAKMPVADFRAAVVRKLLDGIKKKTLRQISGDDLYGLGTSLNFLLENVELTKNPIPRIGRYFGPADNLKDITFDEFVKLGVLVANYRRSSEIEWIDEICAVLYRPRRMFWKLRKRWMDTTDCRVRLRDKDISARKRRIARASSGERFAVYLLVTGVMTDLVGMFPHIFTERKNNRPGSGWPGLIISLADGRTDNDSLDRVMKSNMYNVLMGLEQRAIEYQKMLDKTEKHD